MNEKRSFEVETYGPVFSIRCCARFLETSLIEILKKKTIMTTTEHTLTTLQKTFNIPSLLSWNESSPVSFARWTIGSNPSLGFTQGREIIVDRQTGFSGWDAGGSVENSSWAGFDLMRYKSPYDMSTRLQIGQTRVQTGQVLINIAAP